MPDWRGLAQRRLIPLELDSAREEEIIAELAGHLQDLYADLIREGTPEEEAVQSALSAAAGWNELRREIEFAINEEGIMNYRVRTLWLPGAFTLALSSILLRLLQIPSAPSPHVFWAWHGTYLVLYWQWLLSLPLIGALGAYLSRRAGGKILERILAASLPIAGLACVLALSFCLVMVFPHGEPLSMRLVAFSLYLLGWGLAPFLLLLLGALPFLRRVASAQPGQAVVPH